MSLSVSGTEATLQKSIGNTWNYFDNKGKMGKIKSSTDFEKIVKGRTLTVMQPKRRSEEERRATSEAMARGIRRGEEERKKRIEEGKIAARNTIGR